jgi:DnaJ-class molecular chaperone
MFRHTNDIYTIKDPYQELGALKTDSAEKISNNYKKMMMSLHPDKKDTAEFKKLGITEHERVTILKRCMDAYKLIKVERSNQAFPEYKDFNIKYEISAEYVQPSRDFEQTNEYKSMPDFNKQDKQHFKNTEASLKSNFSTSKFNSAFTANKDYLKQNGYEDPNERGSAIFGNTSDADRSSRTFQNYSSSRSNEVPVISQDEMKKRMKSHTMELQVRGDDNFNMLNKGIGYHEIGGPVFGDMSITTHSLVANDLDTVYGQDLEYFEDSMMRNNKDLSKMRSEYDSGAVPSATDMADRMRSYVDNRTKQDMFKPKKIAKPVNGFKVGLTEDEIDIDGMDDDIAEQYIRTRKEIAERDRVRKQILETQEKFYNKQLSYNPDGRR